MVVGFAVAVAGVLFAGVLFAGMLSLSALLPLVQLLVGHSDEDDLCQRTLRGAHATCTVGRYAS